MPKRNGSGPEGMGPMTGRSGGLYAGESMPSCFNPMYGRGYVFGSSPRAGRRSCRNWPRFGYDYGFPKGGMNRQQERDVLREHAAYLESTLENIRARVAELEE